MLNTKAQDGGYVGDRMGSETEDAVIRKGPVWSSEATGGYARITFITAPHFSLHMPKLLGSTHFPHLKDPSFPLLLLPSRRDLHSSTRADRTAPSSTCQNSAIITK